MSTQPFTSIQVQTQVEKPIEHVWKIWTTPQHIMMWNNASDDWHTTRAENDLQIGGKFLSRMEAKDGSFGFDFEGIYTNVISDQLIEYKLADERKVSVRFELKNESTIVTEIFDAENENPIEMQRAGWQSILDNFKSYAESV
jgi:uncharacterized protein YndB with AHSA1/START domain